MAELLPRLDLPDDFHDWPQQAQADHWESQVQLEELSDALVEEFDLPEHDGIPYLNKKQLAELVRKLDTTTGGRNYGGHE
jgi:hypothetical protein